MLHVTYHLNNRVNGMAVFDDAITERRKHGENIARDNTRSAECSLDPSKSGLSGIGWLVGHAYGTFS